VYLCDGKGSNNCRFVNRIGPAKDESVFLKREQASLAKDEITLGDEDSQSNVRKSTIDDDDLSKKKRLCQGDHNCGLDIWKRRSTFNKAGRRRLFLDHDGDQVMLNKRTYHRMLGFGSHKNWLKLQNKSKAHQRRFHHHSRKN